MATLEFLHNIAKESGWKHLNEIHIITLYDNTCQSFSTFSIVFLEDTESELILKHT